MIMAGRLRTKISFFEVTKIKNEYSEDERALKYLFSTRAERMNVDNSFVAINGGYDSQMVYKFRCHYKRSIHSKLVIEVNDNLFEITDVENVRGENKEMVVDAIDYTQD